jgi:hypothetical protein
MVVGIETIKDAVVMLGTWTRRLDTRCILVDIAWSFRFAPLDEIDERLVDVGVEGTAHIHLEHRCF